MCDRLFGWLAEHGEAFVPLGIVILSSLATGLSRYPRAEGTRYWLSWIAGVLSVVTHRDAPGSLKWPLVPPPAPPPRLTDVINAGPNGSPPEDGSTPGAP